MVLALNLFDQRKSEQNSTYSVAYDFGSGIYRVVRVGEGVISKNPLKTGRLQIQRAGIDFRVESLDFEEGKVESYEDLRMDNHVILDGVVNQSRLEGQLKRFAGEFKEIFQVDRDLKIYLPTHFTSLQKYLEQDIF